MASDPHWIEHAHLNKGAFTKTADKAGKSVHAEAESKKGSSGKTGARARLALTLEGLKKAKH